MLQVLSLTGDLLENTRSTTKRTGPKIGEAPTTWVLGFSIPTPLKK